MTRPAMAAAAERSREFAPDAFPLDPGIRLLEASAGTGKTFALAHLVLRLVAERGLSLRRLLVVTFTEAAAAELRDRIGRRLQDALDGLENPDGPAPDPVLRQWLADVAEGIDRRTLQGRLLLALEDLDAADVTTIHGFCRRTLQRQTLAAGLPPELRIEDDADASISQVVHDYWRRQVLPLPVGILTQLRQHGITPETLRRVLGTIDGDPALDLDPLPAGLAVDLPLAETLPPLLERRWSLFRQEWQRRSRDLEEDFRAAAGQWRALGAKKTGSYTPRPRKDRVAEVDAWLSGPAGRNDERELVHQELLVNYFHPAAFSKVARPLETDGSASPGLPQRPLLEAVAQLVDGPSEWIALHACHWGRGELRGRRRRRGALGFSQLLEALDPSDDEVARSLLERVGQRHDVALIDEFQDTDPIQWRILRRAFGRGDHALVMVGDPKQAIYRFRGGDLATYKAARQRAEGRFELLENHRSTEALVEALNALMAPGLRRSTLPVPAVRARARRSGPAGAPIEMLWLGGNRPAGEKLPGVTAIEQEVAGRIATHVVGLLGRGLELGCGEAGDPPPRRSLHADDICLLVDSHRQAEMFRQALEVQGIASRLLSKADVFDSPAATVLQRALDALADPADPNRLRLLAASPLLSWSAADLAAPDSLRWSALAGSLERLASELPSRGLLGVLAALLESPGMARLAVQGRLWADLQQVAQLVGERLHAEQLGPAATADWLRRIRHDPDRAVPDAHQTHSDRVDGAVSVVTIHRSKGLEYPVVICPTLWREGGRSQRTRGWDGVRWLPPGADRPRLDLHTRREWGEGWAAARQHRLDHLAERERIAYVAVTRAQHLLVLAWGPASGESASPLFPWLFAAEPLPAPDGDDTLVRRSDDDWRALLEEEIRRRRLPIRLVDRGAAAPERWRRPSPPRLEELGLGPVPRHRPDSTWGRSSYTSWTRSALPHRSSGAAALEEGRDTDDPEPDRTQAASPSPAAAGGGSEPAASEETTEEEAAPLGSFPRGAAAGECLHRILEGLDYREPLSEPANRTVVEGELRRAGLEQEPLPPLLEGLERVRRTPFGGALGDFRLERLERNRRLNEMNFDLTLDHVDARRLAAPFREHPGGAFGGEYAERVASLPIASRGFLTGSIDLVFTARSRWWVLDWKSNWLGERDAEGRPLSCGPRHYDRDAMTQLMATHHYPLQAHLYLVALHRYLRWRLPGYEPRRHLGGYVYVFLRGVPEPRAARRPAMVPGLFIDTPPVERLQALDAVLGGGRVTP